MAVGWICLLFLATAAYVESYKLGAPSMACWWMSPWHGHASQSNANAPFKLTALRVGTKYKVILQTKPGYTSTFKGFFIQARQGNSGYPVGQFDVPPANVGYQIVNCPDGSGRTVNSAITHTSSQPASILTAIWNPSGINVRGVRFYATVVQNYSTFWVGIPSLPL